MGIFKSSKKVASHVVDVRVDKWVSLEYLTETADNFKNILLDSVIPKKATFTETFEEAMARLELTEADLIKRQKEFTQLFYFFLGLSIAIIGYGLYLAFTSSMVTALIAFCLSVYTFSQAFRFHFWLFQIKHRKLGCTVREWLNAEISSKPKAKNQLPANAPKDNVAQSSQSKANE